MGAGGRGEGGRRAYEWFDVHLPCIYCEVVCGAEAPWQLGRTGYGRVGYSVQYEVCGIVAGEAAEGQRCMASVGRGQAVVQGNTEGQSMAKGKCGPMGNNAGLIRCCSALIVVILFAHFHEGSW